MATQNADYTGNQRISDGSPQNLGASMANYAQTNSWMGELGARATMSGSAALMTMMGYEAGLNPHGTALPPITKADQMYLNAYNQQSQMTLSTQANELRLNAQVELSKAYKLTPELVMQYEETVAQGMEDILKLAPMGVKQDLRFKMANSMLHDSANLKEKMITQHKQDVTDLWKHSKSQDLRSIYDTGVSGDAEVAHALYQSQLNDNAEMRQSGAITAAQELAANDAARKTYLSGKYIGEALKARASGTEAEFFSRLGNDKPNDLTFEEWPQVAEATASYLSNLDKLQSEKRQISTSEYLLKLADNPLSVTDSDLSDLEGVLTPSQMNKLKTKTIIAQRKAMNDMAAQQVAVAGFDDPDAFSGMTEKEKNGAFHSLVTRAIQAAKNNGDVLEEFDAETMVAADAGGAVPAFTKKLSARLRSPNVEMVEQAINAFDLIHDRFNAAQNLGAVLDDTKGLGIMYAYKSRVLSGVPKDIALQDAREAVLNDAFDRKQVDASYNDYMNHARLTGETSANIAMRMVGVSKKVPIANANLMGYKVERLLYGNYITTKDMPAAIEMTKAAVNRAYGETEYYGDKTVVFAPLERTTGVPIEGKGVVQADAYNQMKIQLESMRNEFNMGRIDTWIETPELPSVNDMLALTQKHTDIASKRSIKGIPMDALVEYAKESKQVRDYVSGGQMTAIRHTRNPSTGEVTSEEINLDIVPMNTLQLTNDGSTIGGYEIVERTQNGFRSISTHYGRPLPITYNPNPSQLQRDYAALTSSVSLEDPKAIFERMAKERRDGGALEPPNPFDEAREEVAKAIRKRKKEKRNG